MKAKQLLKELKQWAASNKEKVENYLGVQALKPRWTQEYDELHRQQERSEVFSELISKLENMENACKPTFRKGDFVRDKVFPHHNKLEVSGDSYYVEMFTTYDKEHLVHKYEKLKQFTPDWQSSNELAEYKGHKVSITPLTKGDFLWKCLISEGEEVVLGKLYSRSKKSNTLGQIRKEAIEWIDKEMGEKYGSSFVPTFLKGQQFFDSHSDVPETCLADSFLDTNGVECVLATNSEEDYVLMADSEDEYICRYLTKIR